MQNYVQTQHKQQQQHKKTQHEQQHQHKNNIWICSKSTLRRD